MNKIFSVLLIIFLTGCSATSQNSMVTPTLQPTVTLFPTVTPIFVTPLVTPTLASTFTPTQLPLQTPLPTLSSEEDFLKFISFTGKSDCKLPCLAGIVPNQTNWDEAVFALRPMKSVAKLEILTNEDSIYGKVNAILWHLSSDEFRIDGNFLLRSNISLIRMNFESFSDTTPSYSLPLPKL